MEGKDLAVLLVSHGSREEETAREVESLLLSLREDCPCRIMEAAFLEMNAPDIASGLRRCIERGAREIVVVLNFLNSGVHVLKDIPSIVEQAKSAYPEIRFVITPPVGQHSRMKELFKEMIREAREV